MAKDKLSDICNEAVEFLRLCNDANSTNEHTAMEAFRFRGGDQWPTDIQNSRRLDTRPCLTVNKVDTYCRQIENNMRQQRPRAKIEASDAIGSKEVAKVLQGMVRNIEHNRGGVDLALDTAAACQVTGGFGYYRLRADYESENSFDQEIFYERIENPFMVKYDPSSTSPDGSDCKQCLIGIMMNKKEFSKQYPDADTMGFVERWIGASTDWENKDEIFVAEYYKIVYQKAKLVRLSNGKDYYKDELPEANYLALKGLMIMDERDSMRGRVKWYKLTCHEVLEERDIPGRFIPVFPVYGNISFVDGKRTYSGIVKNAMDPQRMINFFESAATECVALAPKAKYMIPEGADEGYEVEWQQANISARPGLHYKTKSESGTDIPAPQPIAPAPVPTGLLTMLQNNDQNLRSVIGISDPAQRIEGNVSGKALVSEQQQTENAVFHFYDNLTRTLRHSSRVIVDWIPYYYSGQRVVRIVGPDDISDTVTINMRNAVGQIENDVTAGKYDVVMETGPGYASKQQEALQFMAPLFERNPDLIKVAGDIFFRNMNFHGSDVIADRLAATNPLAQKETISKLPKEAQIMMKGLQDQLQQAQAQIQAMDQEIKFRTGVEKVRQEGANRRELIKAHSAMHIEDRENEAWSRSVALQEQGSTKRTLLTASAKAHDTEVKAETALNVERLKQGKNPVISKHKVHGDIDEDDIETTMKKYGLSRKAVMKGLEEMNGG